jgi:hypothetical protein
MTKMEDSRIFKTRAAFTALICFAVVASAFVAWRSLRPASSASPSTASARTVSQSFVSGAHVNDTTGVDWAALHTNPQSFVVRGVFSVERGASYSIGSARRTDTGVDCLIVSGPQGSASEACGQPGLFSRSPIIWLESFDGGPAPRDRTSESISGIVAPDVGNVNVVTSDGNATAVELSSGHAFLFSLSADQLSRGVYVDHMDVRANDGATLDTITLNDSR